MLLNGQASPIFYVGPGQINFVVPTANVPTAGSAQVQVLQSATGLILGSGTVGMNTVAPAMFTTSQTGIGQIAARNQDDTVNSPSNAAARNSVIQLFGTGQGIVPGGPQDGHLPSGIVNTPSKPQVFIGGFQVPSANVAFSGLAPCCVGLWQINVTIPETTAPGNTVSLLVTYQSYNSFSNPAHITTIAVKEGKHRLNAGFPCADTSGDPLRPAPRAMTGHSIGP